MKIAVVGLGKLGAPIAAVFAESGHEVWGVDADPGTVQLVNEGRPPVLEPQIEDFMDRNRGRLRAVHDAAEATAATDCTFVVVPTPSGPDGSFSMEFALEAAGRIGAGLASRAAYHVVALSSTVMPGATDGQFIPALERASGKKCGRDFGVCYNPEFIALGNVIHDLLHPDMVLIGESDPRAGAVLESLYCEMVPQASMQRMNCVNAEVAKLSVNTFVTTKISYANMLAELCEALPGADASVVTRAVGCDKRIGKGYLQGALGYGGPCFPRDNAAFLALSRKANVPVPLAAATDEVNRRQPRRMADLAAGLTGPGELVGVFGMAYKPDTPVAEESQGVLIAAELHARGLRVGVHDRLALEAAGRVLGDRATYFRDERELAAQCRTAVFTTPWPEYRKLTRQDFAGAEELALIDCWRLFDRQAFGASCTYVSVGSFRPAATVQTRLTAAS